jgi:hypothetical protein
VSGAHSEGTNRWVLGVRLLANQIDRATWRNTLTYQVHPSLSLGVEYNPLANDVGPLANWVPLSETEWRPSLMLGTSSDRIGTPHGRAFYATVSKNLEPWLNWSVSPYIGAVYGTYEDRWRPLAGASVDLARGFSSQFIFDGVHAHGLLNYSYKRHVFSLVLVRWKDPGISYSISF